MPSPYIRVRIFGQLPGGETWSVNPCLGGNFDAGAIGSAELQSLADGVAALNSGNVIPDSFRTQLSNSASVAGVRAELYSTGTTLSDVREALLATPKAGLGSASKPYQTSIVTSLLSGIPGRSYRGRLYWPALGAQIDPGTLRISASIAGGLADDCADWLSDVADAHTGSVPLTPIIWSKTRGAQTGISSVRVGDILDTQRRRRDSLSEVYATAAL